MVTEDILREQWRTHYKPAEDDAPSSSVCFSIVVGIETTYLSFLQQPDDDDHLLTTLERLLSEMCSKIF